MRKSALTIAAVAGVAAILALSPATAQVPPGVNVVGTVSLTGMDLTNNLDSTIQFGNNFPFINNGLAQINVTTGVLSVVPVPTNVTMIGAGSALSWTTPTQWIGGKLFGSGALDETITSFNPAIIDAANGLTLSGQGQLTGSGINLPSFWTLTTQLGTGTGNITTFSAEALAVPGPIVGAGLPGLIAALGGLVAMARRRRKQLA